MRTLITNIIMTPGVTTETQIPFIHNAEIQIDDHRIVYAGAKENAPRFEADQVIDGEGALAMPGLCNLHTHTPMTMMRSAGSDLPLERWLNEMVWPVEKFLTDDSVKAGSDLGILEMIRCGTTSFNDMYFRMDRLAESVETSGIRAMLGYGVIDFDESCADLIPGIEFAMKWQHAAGDRIRVNIAPHSEAATTEKLLLRSKEVAEEMEVPLHIHICETSLDRTGCIERHGMTAAAYLEKLGLLDVPMIAAHCVWMDDPDIEIFSKHGVYIAHNPVSNLKLASGIAPISKMLNAGCRVTLGTDGVASNNNLNLWEEIKLMPLLQKGTLLDPTVVTPAQTLAAATSIGAKALGYDDLGLLKEGYLADIILVDVGDLNMCPSSEMEGNLIYAVESRNVKMTMVDGKVLYHNGVFTTMDPKRVLETAHKEALGLMTRAGRAK
ncbi:MAG: amidohydrolase [Clostridiales bacterium]|nr:amidohydrolase [Clostridiales bacterium]